MIFPSELSAADVGQVITIATKVKSKPIRGQIKEVDQKGAFARVLVTGSFGDKWHTLTAKDEIALGDS